MAAGVGRAAGPLRRSPPGGEPGSARAPPRVPHRALAFPLRFARPPAQWANGRRGAAGVGRAALRAPRMEAARMRPRLDIGVRRARSARRRTRARLRGPIRERRRDGGNVARRARPRGSARGPATKGAPHGDTDRPSSDRGPPLPARPAPTFDGQPAGSRRSHAREKHGAAKAEGHRWAVTRCADRGCRPKARRPDSSGRRRTCVPPDGRRAPVPPGDPRAPGPPGARRTAMPLSGSRGPAPE